MILFLARTAVTALSAAACIAAGPVTRSSEASWHRYVRSPSSNTVKPVRIIAANTTGNVENAQGMVDGSSTATFSRDSDSSDVPSVVVDFGQNVVGLLSIEFEGSYNKSAGLPGIRLAFSETMEFLTDRSDYTRSDNAGGQDKITQGTDQIAVRNEAYTWTAKLGCQHGRQVCSDGLHGFRYLRVSLDALESDAPYTSSLGSVFIKSISLEWSSYLGTPDTFTGWFECSDRDLTQWWYDGVYTVDIGTDFFFANETEPRGAASDTLEGRQVLFDGAKRDRDPYVGDLAVASLTSYLSHDFAESSRNVLEDLAWHQRSDGWIPPASINNYTLPLFDYPLWWAVCSVDLVMYTGNTSYAQTYWDNIVRVLDGYYPQYIDKETGLVVKSASLGYGDYAFLPRSGPITYYNALYVHALRYTAQLARLLGGKYTNVAKSWESRASSVASALNKHNFDDKVGAFYDGGPCPGEATGTYCNVHAQDGNSIAIMAGIPEAAQSQKILNYWSKAASHTYGNSFYDSTVLSPNDHFDERVYAFISYFELEARFLTPGKADSAFEEMNRLYGWMASHDPKITMWEGIGPGGSLYEGPYTSMAHGWSTGIVPLMSNHVLGVKPVSPGFKEWQFCPVVDVGGLTWARGVVPTPQGGIEVSWERHGSGSAVVLEMSVKAPKGTTGKVCIPAISGASAAVVKVDGREIGSAASAGVGGAASMVINVEGGQHTITVA